MVSYLPKLKKKVVTSFSFKETPFDKLPQLLLHNINRLNEDTKFVD